MWRALTELLFLKETHFIGAALFFACAWVLDLGLTIEGQLIAVQSFAGLGAFCLYAFMAWATLKGGYFLLRPQWLGAIGSVILMGSFIGLLGATGAVGSEAQQIATQAHLFWYCGACLVGRLLLLDYRVWIRHR